MARKHEQPAAGDPAGRADDDASKASARSASELFEVADAEPGTGPDLLRRLATLGFSGLFTTESAIRGALGDTLPREWIEFFAQQSDRTRDEFVSRLATEFVRVLENVDIVDLAEQMLAGRTIEVSAQFRLGPKDDEPRAKNEDETNRSSPRRKSEAS